MHTRQFRRHFRWYAAVAFLAIATSSLAADSSPIRVVEGACGTLSFVSSVGHDYNSALQAMQARLQCNVRSGPCKIEPFEIEVAPVQPTHFYALKVVNARGMLEYGVSNVITTDGRLFTILWCPD